MGLEVFWFILIAILWTGFFVLEGFDLGVGMLHGVVGRSDTERRVAINTVGPFWDGNEVWLVVAGAAIFAAFPAWYATMFSSLYLALLLVLVALMARGVSFEYRGRSDSPPWRRTWSFALTAGSALIPLLIGVGLGDLLSGLPIDQAGNYTGTFWNLLTPYGILVGITLVAICVLHGATFLVLKTTGSVLERSRATARLVVWPTAVIVLVFAIWTQVIRGGVVPGPLQTVTVLAVLGVAWLVHARHDGWAFLATTVTMATAVSAIFAELYPNVLVSSTNKAYSLTVAGTASAPYTLKVMTFVALIFVPLVLLYQGWSYYVFRRRVTAPPQPAAQTEEIANGGR